MSLLNELACRQHQEKGFTTDCYGCELNVTMAQLQQALNNVGALNPHFKSTQLVLMVPPTLARKLYFALGKAVAGAELTPTDRDLLQVLKDMAQDCVEKLRV
jgi:hypothetical protein